MLHRLSNPERKMEHLTCFIAGNLALGVQTGAIVGRKAEEYLDLAKALTYTCYQMYVRMPTGEPPPLLPSPLSSRPLCLSLASFCGISSVEEMLA